MGEKALIEVELAKKDETELEITSGDIDGSPRETQEARIPDDVRKTLTKVVMKELDPTQQYPKVKAKRLGPIENLA